MSGPATEVTTRATLKRSLRFRDLVLYGIILIQPTAPMPSFGVIYQEARGHVVTAILCALVAMLFTSISYGRMARVYPEGGSAFMYVGKELHPALGYITGWCMAMDYILNPLICTIWCSKAAQNFLPEVPYTLWAIFFAGLFTLLNLRGVETSARINAMMAAALGCSSSRTSQGRSTLFRSMTRLHSPRKRSFEGRRSQSLPISASMAFPRSPMRRKTPLATFLAPSC
jgi:putrescine importer